MLLDENRGKRLFESRGILRLKIMENNIEQQKAELLDHLMEYWIEVSELDITPHVTIRNAIEKYQAITAQKPQKGYSKQRQLTAMNRLECCNRKRNYEIKYRRFLIWLYVRDKFGVSLSSIGIISGHDHATVSNGLKSIKNDLKYLDVQSIRENVFCICDEVFYN